MIAESKQTTDHMLMAKKVEDLKLAEKAAIDDATEQAGATIAEAEAAELKAQQEADNAYMRVQETAEKEFLKTKQSVGEKAAQQKIQTTVEKNNEYDQATQVWEAQKREARAEQLKSFKSIESDEQQAVERMNADHKANEDAL